MTQISVGIDYFKALLKAFRKAINEFTGKNDASIWIGETGWSSPVPGKLTNLAWCHDYGSRDALLTYYENILGYNGSLDEGLTGAEHIFYFAVRDISYQGNTESFGLITNCNTDSCKVQSSESTNDKIIV